MGRIVKWGLRLIVLALLVAIGLGHLETRRGDAPVGGQQPV